MPDYWMFIKGSTTTLSQDLKDGDTVIYLTDVSGFKISESTPSYQLGLIFWNYKDCDGNEYGIETYSRNIWNNIYNYDGVDYNNNTITLKEPWSNGTFEAGTTLSQSESGGVNYGLLIGNLSSHYQTYSNTLKGESNYNDYAYTKFNIGTKYVIPYIVYSEPMNLSIKEVTFEVIE